MNLATLKKTADQFTFEMVRHSWYPTNNPLLGLKRTIDIKQTNAIKFNGGSWLYWPTAKNIKINEHAEYIHIAIDLEQEENFAKTMEYKLYPKT